MKKLFTIITAAWLLGGCSSTGTKKEEPDPLQKEAQAFLDEYSAKYKALVVVSNEAEWKLNTRIEEGDTLSEHEAKVAKEATAKFSGSKANIENAKKFLASKDKLTPLQVKQLERVLYLAANNPETIQEVVVKRIAAETNQTKNLFGFGFKIDGKKVTPNIIDETLKKEKDLAKRQKAWEASKEVGKVLKDGLVNLRELRNKTVQGLGYSDYFTYQVSDYGMTTDEMMQFLRRINGELWPLYRELHTYARYELAKKYGKEVPDYIPAHWLSNRWGQDWNEMVNVEGMNLDSALRSRSAEWLVKQAEKFYVSLGFEELPPVFWEKSSLYPVPPDATYQKNNHASAWHMDFEKDVRSLMSVEPNSEWYETTHHELGHIYYYLSYSRPEVPMLLREGANRAYHEALGSLMGLASMQKPFAAGLGLVAADTPTDTVKALLKEALNFVVFIPWSAGVMSEFEYELYSKNLPPDQFNKKWWELVKKYQGIVPPAERSEEYCDAASKTHINDDAAQYYDYAMSYLLLFQFHDHIANKILKQDPRATNYYGNKEVGKFIEELMSPGMSGDWRTLLKEKTGEELGARAMLSYFQPLMSYLKEVNKGRTYTLPETL